MIKWYGSQNKLSIFLTKWNIFNFQGLWLRKQAFLIHLRSLKKRKYQIKALHFRWTAHTYNNHDNDNNNICILLLSGIQRFLWPYDNRGSDNEHLLLRHINLCNNDGTYNIQRRCNVKLIVYHSYSSFLKCTLNEHFNQD